MLEIAWQTLRASLQCAVVGLALLPAAVSAQAIESVQERLATPLFGDGASGDNFGIAVALEGDRAVVGAYGDVIVAPGAPTGVAQGSVYVFSRQPGGSWLRAQKLTPAPVGEDGDNFGVALTLRDGVLAVAAPRRRAGGLLEAGAVFIYGDGLGGLAQRQIVIAPIPGINQRFGTAIALGGLWLAVGAPAADGGRVYLFRRAPDGTYTYAQSLNPEAGPELARFGYALALQGDELLIGAPDAQPAGAVYRSQFDGVSWTSAQRLPLVAPAGAELGGALAMDADLALVGAPGAGAGMVLMMTLDGGTWGPVATLTPTPGFAGDRFGNSIAVDAARIAIGAVGALGGEGQSYVYARDGLLLAAPQILDIADGGNANRFGTSVALSSGGLLVGADLDQVGPNRLQGSARWYEPTVGGVIAAARLDNGDGALLDRYGSAVAVDGTVAMVGAYLEDTAAGGDAGRVHWFERVGSQWVRRGAIDAPDSDIEDRFGIAIDIDGDRAAIGAYWDIVGDNVDQGSVYIFHRQGQLWVLEAKVHASDGRARDLFGFALSLEGERLLVGARGAIVPFVDQGTAYVFDRSESGWSQTARLDLPTPAAFSYFGASVALAGDRALVGAPGVNAAPNFGGAGAAYVYLGQSGNWRLERELRAPVLRSNAAFGYAVDADAQRLLVGAFQDGSVAQGAAYLYSTQTQALEASLWASAPQAVEAMGMAVALDGNSVLLGAPAFDIGTLENAGAAHVFERGPTGWTERRVLIAADAAEVDTFGRAVAAQGGSLMFGAPNKAGDNPQEGMAYAAAGDTLFAGNFE